MAQVPTPPLKALDKCANPECGHDRADHLPRCTNGEIGPPYKYCQCDSFKDSVLTPPVRTPQPQPQPRNTDPAQEAP